MTSEEQGAWRASSLPRHLVGSKLKAKPEAEGDAWRAWSKEHGGMSSGNKNETEEMLFRFQYLDIWKKM